METVTFQLTDTQKRALKRWAEEEDKAMVELVRRLLSRELPAEHVAAATEAVERERARESAVATPETSVEAFVERRVFTNPTADPIPKQEVYERYCEFVEAMAERDRDVDADTTAEPASQQLLSRRLGRLDGVSAARHYINGDRRRCFEGLALDTDDGVALDFGAQS